MIFYGMFSCKRDLKQSPRIDYLEFEFDKADPVFVPDDLEPVGTILSCDWDESDWDYDDEIGAGQFRCKGVYVNQRYANGHIDMFKSAKLDTLQVYSPEDADFQLTSLLIVDGEEKYSMPDEAIVPREVVIEND